MQVFVFLGQDLDQELSHIWCTEAEGGCVHCMRTCGLCVCVCVCVDGVSSDEVSAHTQFQWQGLNLSLCRGFATHPLYPSPLPERS